MSNPTQSLPPGFRFHPTDEELIIHYLRNRAASSPCPVSIIAEVDIYKFDPWELPSKALFGDREWYFFSPRDRKYPNGVRPNRAAASGYWKATGTDKPISSGKENIGVKKALVFYRGRPPKGIKTNWIMHEYRLAEANPTNTYRPIKLRDTSMRLDDWVLCRIYKKSNHQESTSADPPMAEREQEDCAVEDTYMVSLPNIQHQQQQQEQTTFKLHKSCSISDFLEDYTALSRLFDNLPEMPGEESGSAMNNLTAKQPFIMNQKNSFMSGGEINNDNGYSGQQMSQAGPSALVTAANYLKRQRPVVAEEETHGLLHPAKKRSNEACSFTNMGSTFDGALYGMINQSLLNQQMLLNAHLGLQ